MASSTLGAVRVIGHNSNSHDREMGPEFLQQVGLVLNEVSQFWGQVGPAVACLAGPLMARLSTRQADELLQGWTDSRNWWFD